MLLDKSGNEEENEFNQIAMVSQINRAFKSRRSVKTAMMKIAQQIQNITIKHTYLCMDAAHHTNCIIGDEEVGDAGVSGIRYNSRSRASPSHQHLLSRALLCSAIIIICEEVLELSSF